MEVTCPTCKAKPGRYCTTLRGFSRLLAHDSRLRHAERVRRGLALDAENTFTGITGAIAGTKEGEDA